MAVHMMIRPDTPVDDGNPSEVIELLEHLLQAAKAGKLPGIVVGAEFRGRRYLCEAAGSLRKDPMRAIGVATMLTAEMEHRIRRQPTETVL